MASYTTSFPNTENPISEGGNWSNVASTTWDKVIQTTAGTPGFADAPGASSTDDGVAVLTATAGSFGRAQDVTITARISGSPVGNPEIELHIHMTISTGPDSITTYEGDIIWNSNKWDCIPARWNGTQGDFTLMTGGDSVFVTPADGDTWEMKDDGAGNVNFFFNGSAGPSGSNFTDTTFTTGNPGMGLDNTDGHVNIKGYTATDGGISSGPPNVSPLFIMGMG